MPTDPSFIADLSDSLSEVERLQALDRRLAEVDPPCVVNVFASLDRWDELVRFLCELRGRGVMPLLQLTAGAPIADEALLERFQFLADWDQCSLSNVLLVTDRFLPDAYRSALEQESRIEAKFFREWATAATERLGRYPALPWRRFLRNVNEENFRFAKTCVLAQNDAAALSEALKQLLAAKRKTVNIFPKKFSSKQDRPRPEESLQ